MNGPNEGAIDIEEFMHYSRFVLKAPRGPAATNELFIIQVVGAVPQHMVGFCTFKDKLSAWVSRVQSVVVEVTRFLDF